LPGTNTPLLQKIENYGQKSFITMGRPLIEAYCGSLV
jgi:hypothetical protein